MPKKKSNLGRYTHKARIKRLARKAATQMSPGCDRKKKIGNNLNINLVISYK